MRSAFALRIFNGKIIFICSFETPAGVSKLFFHGRGFAGNKKRLCRSRAVKLHLKYNQRLENWGASLAGLRPARDA